MPYLLGSAPLWPPVTASSKTYIDPHTVRGLVLSLSPFTEPVESHGDSFQYEDPTKAVKDFARELDPNLIVIESVIGGGKCHPAPDLLRTRVLLRHGVCPLLFHSIFLSRGRRETKG